jgi:hypothetical protein
MTWVPPVASQQFLYGETPWDGLHGPIDFMQIGGGRLV